MTERAPQRRTRLIALAIVLLGVLNHTPSLGWGFLYDDFLQQFFVHFAGQEPPGNLWNLYDFASASDPDDPLVARGLLPWWTSDDFRIRYFRPVVSLSILADARLYGTWAPGHHLTSLVLFGVFLFVAFELYRALGLPPVAALWALLFLALDDVHALPVGWLAARATLMAALLISATILAVLRYERSRKPLDLALALFLFLLACGSKEDSAIVVPIVALAVLFASPAAASESMMTSLRRVVRSRSVWAFGIVAAAYVVLYARAGYGTNSALHVTPWEEPAEFLTRLATMIPLNLTTLFFGVPGGDLVFTRPQLAGVLAGMGVLGVVLLGWILWRWARPRPLAAFALGWALLALAPASVVATSDRVLSIASVGTAMALGLVMDQLGSARRLARERRYPALGVWLLCIVTGVLVSIPALHLRGWMFATMAVRDREAIVRAPIGGDEGTGSDVIVVNAPSALLSLFMPLTVAVVHEDPAMRVYPLQLGRRAIEWSRESDRELVVTYGSPPLLGQRFELLFRTGDGQALPQATFQTSAFSATVLETDEAGIRRVRFRSDRSFDDPSYRFLVWEDGAYRRALPPAVGKDPVSIEAPLPTSPWVP